MNSGHYDVVIIGGGAAGLSAGLALARSRRSVLIVDSGEPRNGPASHMHNFLSRDGLPPAELLTLGRAEVTGYGGEVVAGTVASAKPAGDGFQVSLADGQDVQARRLLLATGLRDELPAIPGLDARWGRDVVHCPYCHGWEVRDQAVGVLATGPFTVHQALLFRQLTDDVIVFGHTRPSFGDEERAKLVARGVRIAAGEVAGIEVADDRLTGVRLATGQVIPRTAVAVAPVFIARSEAVESLGLEIAEQRVGGQLVARYVQADPMGATSVPGVWAAGNVADPAAQVIIAAAAGLKAAAAINADLVEEDARLAMSARLAGRRRPASPRRLRVPAGRGRRSGPAG